MKIDLVIPKLHMGGSERQVTGLAIGLARAGHDVCVVTLRSGGVLVEELRANNINIWSSDSGLAQWFTSAGLRSFWQSTIAIFRLVGFWRRRQPHVIQAWLPEAQIVALPVAKTLKIPQRVMAVRSMSTAVNLTPVKRFLLWTAARCSTLVIANSNAVLGDPGWPIQERQGCVIRNAVSLPARTSTPGIEPARGIVVANLTRIKGHHLLLKALTLLEDPPAFTFVGTGPEGSALRTLRDELGLENRIIFAEDVTDPGPLLRDAQFLVHPSPSEGLPNAILEAMASGLPVIAFRVGGIPEIIDDGKTGILVEPGDLQGLARAIRNVAGDPRWRARAGTEAAVRAKSFTWDSVVQANVDLLSCRSPRFPPTHRGDASEDR